MFPTLDDSPQVKDSYHVGVLNRGQTVGNDEHCPSFHQSVQGLLYEVLVLSIQCAKQKSPREGGISAMHTVHACVSRCTHTSPS